MALTARQEDNLHRLIQQDCYALQDEARRALAKQGGEAEEKVIADWRTSNPQVNDVVKKIERYKRTVAAKTEAFAQELEALGIRVHRPTTNGRDPAANTFDAYRLTVSAVPDDIREKATQARLSYERKADTVWHAIEDIKKKKYREVIMATITDNVDDLLKLPTVDEILAGL